MTKYRAKPVVIDNIRFDSTAEGTRYMALKMLLRAGEIRDLETHKRYDLHVRNVKIGYYEADFVYYDMRKGREIIEDVKGYRTDMYRWKKRHFEAEYGREITEVKA